MKTDVSLCRYDFRLISSILNKDYPLHYGCSDTALGGGMSITDTTKTVWDILYDMHRDIENLQSFCKDYLNIKKIEE